MIVIDIDPVAFVIGSLTVRWYGICVALAVLTVILLGWRELRKRTDLPQPPDPLVVIIAIISGFAVSKGFHVVDKWGYYSQHPQEIFSGAGLTIYGAIIGATLAMWVYSRVRQFNFGYFADLVAPGIILGQAIGRVGCTINGCCCGEVAPDWLPWSIVYSPDYPPPDGYFSVVCAPLGTPLVPTQIYEIIFALVLFGVLFKLRGRLKPDGTLFLIYLASYSAWRIGIDSLRGDATIFALGLHQAQVVGIIVLVFTITLLVWQRLKYKAATGESTDN